MKSLRTTFALLFVTFLGIAVVSSLVEAAEKPHPDMPLQYTLKKGQKFAYNIKIFADLPTSEKTYEGAVHYEVESIGPFRLKCTGGLNLKTDPKPRDFGVGIPPMLHRRPPFGLLGNSSFNMAHLSSTIELAPDGKVLKVKGRKHIPYLLGDLSTLVFEQLDGSRQDAWTRKRDMAVAEVSMFFGGFGPFSRGGTETVSSADESHTFKLLKKRGDGLLDFAMTYRFETVCDEGKFILEGKGVWTFNQKLGISESLKMKYELIEEESNISVKIPLEVQYTRFSDEELAAYLKKQEAEEQKKKELSEKRKAPITGNEQREYIEALTSGDKDKVREALHELSGWRDKTPNLELADAIRPFTNSSDSFISHLAKSAMEKFSTEAGLKEAYSSHMPLDDNEIGQPIRKGMKLPEGLMIAAHKGHGGWYHAARVMQAINEQEFYVEFNSVIPDRHDKQVVEWSNIRLAPPELEQPQVDEADLRKLYGSARSRVKKTVESTRPATPKRAASKVKSSELAALKGFRTWTDDSGTFQVKAKYIEADDKVLQLQQEDGRKVKVPINRLSEEDRKVVEQLRSMPSNPFESNPFE